MAGRMRAAGTACHAREMSLQKNVPIPFGTPLGRDGSSLRAAAAATGVAKMISRWGQHLLGRDGQVVTFLGDLLHGLEELRVILQDSTEVRPIQHKEIARTL